MSIASMVILVAGIFAIVATMLVVMPKIVFAMIRGPLSERIGARYPPNEVLVQDLTANSFGVESKGALQLRGNGGLVLTRSALHFFMVMPKTELVVPLDKVFDVSTVYVHLGKTVARPLLKVRYRSDPGDDSIAWYVADPSEWKQKLHELTGKSVG